MKSLFTSAYDYDDGIPDCVAGTLPVQDQWMNFVGSPIIILCTMIIIFTTFRFKELRQQPGDIILGIAISDLILACCRLGNSLFPNRVEDGTLFCTVFGSFNVFAGTAEYLYNVIFNIYFIISLRNALKQDKIPKMFFHIFALTISLVILVFSLVTNRIGKTFIKTCALRSTCDISTHNYVLPILLTLDVMSGFYAYNYVRKNTSKCTGSHAKRTAFLKYYLQYIVWSTVIYTCLSVTHFIGPHLNILHRQNFSTAFVNSVYNMSKIASPLVLFYFRFRDPLINKLVMSTLFFYRRNNNNNTIMESLDDPLSLQSNTHPVSSLSDVLENEEGFIFNQLTLARRTEITYSLLSYILYSDLSERSTRSQSFANMIDTKIRNMYKHQRILQINDETIKLVVPETAREELIRNNVNITPGTLKTYAPEMFTQFLNEDKDFLNIQESLDFVENVDQIADASGPGGGRSGEFFFFSKDRKLIVKTIPDAEMNTLVPIFEKYHDHFKMNPKSLIAKIYGAFTFVSTEYGQRYNFIIMKNLSGFSSTYVKRCYDMKGSKYERQVLKNQVIESKADLKQHGVLKDLDFEVHEQKLFIRDELKEDFVRQIEADSMFFRRAKLIDYSLMVFCIDKNQYEEEEGALNDGFVSKNPLGSMESTIEPGIFYNVGIVDYLQPYNLKKLLEKMVKKTKKLDANLETSTQDPTYYSNRFIQFISGLVERK